jgi:hypothetical protein
MLHVPPADGPLHLVNKLAGQRFGIFHGQIVQHTPDALARLELTDQLIQQGPPIRMF